MTHPTGSLKDTLQRDLQSAIRAQDKVRSATLRMALTSVTTTEVAGKAHRTLSDDEVVAVLVKEAKKRREAAAAFRDAGRPELAGVEEAELEVLQGYLPAQLDDAELDQLVDAAVQQTGAGSMREMGAVMKAVQPQVAGRAEGGRVAAAVRRALS